MEALPDDAIRFELPPALAPDDARAARATVGEQLIDALVALHLIEPNAVGLASLGRTSGYVTRQLTRWCTQLDYARTRPLPALDQVAIWLAAHQPPEPGRACIVHGDYKLDNAIFSLQSPVQLLGIVDWELCLGDPLADLGRLLAFWSGLLAFWSGLLAFWSADDDGEPGGLVCAQ